ncbi:MAG: S8 family serine peptidase [Candidatus Eremiobacteraeota bacterium]|nr:S8 family serine peptidase [Candidatus Eremiobacteraeota bacterium]
MERLMKVAAPLFVALAFAGCNAGGSPNVPGGFAQSSGPSQALGSEASGYAPVCTDPRPGYMNCDALIATTLPPGVAGLTPADFQKAYELPSKTKGAGQIVAIVDAYDNPKVASDLSAYRKNFGLGTAKFAKYNQLGQKKNYPAHCSGSNAGWCLEIDLDVQMVSASCAKCTIWLFEANTNNSSDLYAAVARAAKMGAHIISNSYGGGGGSASYGDFAKPGVTYLASAGDFGYGMQDPADYDTVVSVGGTMLSKRGAKYSERVWPGSGAGCSVVAKPAWQHDPTCAQRTGNDVSAVAFNVAEYDTFGYSGWIVVGGTSISTPLLGGVYGLAGNAKSRQSGKAFWTLSKTSRFRDLHVITKGAVSNCPGSLSGSYLCKAGTGQYKTYSGPAGWGTPKGIGAF